MRCYECLFSGFRGIFLFTTEQPEASRLFFFSGADLAATLLVQVVGRRYVLQECISAQRDRLEVLVCVLHLLCMMQVLIVHGLLHDVDV